MTLSSMYMKQSYPIIQQYNYFQDRFRMYGGPEGNLRHQTKYCIWQKCS